MKLIAIDPGGSVGIAVFEDGKLKEAKTFLWRKKKQKCLEHLDHWIEPGVTVVIEDPSGKTAFARPGMSQRQMLKIATDIGILIERFRHLCEFCEMHGAHVVPKKPVKGGTKWSREMWNAAFPEWAKRQTSQHARDAAVLGKMGVSDLGGSVWWTKIKEKQG